MNKRTMTLGFGRGGGGKGKRKKSFFNLGFICDITQIEKKKTNRHIFLPN